MMRGKSPPSDLLSEKIKANNCSFLRQFGKGVNFILSIFSSIFDYDQMTFDQIKFISVYK